VTEEQKRRCVSATGSPADATGDDCPHVDQDRSAVKALFPCCERAEWCLRNEENSRESECITLAIPVRVKVMKKEVNVARLLLGQVS
jgi:hypothetical protein